MPVASVKTLEGEIGLSIVQSLSGAHSVYTIYETHG